MSKQVQHQAGSVVRGARWLAPWAGVLIVSASLAYAADEALTHRLAEAPAPEVSVTSAGRPDMPEKRDAACVYISTTCVPNTPPASNSHWMKVEWAEESGVKSSIICLTTWDRFADDMLQIRAQDLDSVVTHMCSEVWQSQPT